MGLGWHGVGLGLDWWGLQCWGLGWGWQGWGLVLGWWGLDWWGLDWWGLGLVLGWWGWGWQGWGVVLGWWGWVWWGMAVPPPLFPPQQPPPTCPPSPPFLPHLPGVFTRAAPVQPPGSCMLPRTVSLPPLKPLYAPSPTRTFCPPSPTATLAPPLPPFPFVPPPPVSCIAARGLQLAAMTSSAAVRFNSPRVCTAQVPRPHPPKHTHPPPCPPMTPHSQAVACPTLHSFPLRHCCLPHLAAVNT